MDYSYGPPRVGRQLIIMNSFSVRPAVAGDEPAVIASLTMAFVSDPVLRWMYPEPVQYLAHMPEFVRIFGGRAFEHGSAHVVEGVPGAALWLPPGVEPDEDALVGVLQATVHERELADVFSLLELMGPLHPAEPHWYAPLIGVDPIHQRQGCGSALLDHAVAQFDRTGTVACLDATSEETLPLYQRYGFKVTGTLQAGASPPMFAMVRPPR